MWKYIPFVFKNLLRNRRRTTLTALSMAVSLLLLGILLSVYATFFERESYEEQPLRLVTCHRVSFLVPLPQYYGDRIRQVEGVDEVCIFHWFGGTYIDRRPEHMLPLMAVEPEKVFRVRTESILQPDQLESFQRDRQGLALGKAVAQRLRLQLGDRIVVQGDIYPVDLELVVRAIYEGPDDLEPIFTGSICSKACRRAGVARSAPFRFASTPPRTHRACRGRSMTCFATPHSRQEPRPKKHSCSRSSA